jgi:hypothetical protein
MYNGREFLRVDYLVVSHAGKSFHAGPIWSHLRREAGTADHWR